jgi:hypothetical protein
MSEHDDDFDRELRQWASRPARLTPREAARQVEARINGARRRPAFDFDFGYAAAILAVLALLAFRLNVDRAPDAPALASSPTTVFAPLPENMVLWWIDPDTPVYFAVAPPEGEQGGGS